MRPQAHAYRTNHFLPTDLPHLSDYLLMGTAVEYRQAHSMLAGLPLRNAEILLLQIEEALSAISQELKARGLPEI